MTARHYRVAASLLLVVLIFLCILWEGVLAPLRPGGSWLILKGIFPLAALFGIFNGKRYTYKWMSLFIQFYLLEGLLRASSDHGLSQWLAAGETLIASGLLATMILYVRHTRPAGKKKTAGQ